MRSEDFDKRIKEAAEHHFPAYDETAWKKMHASLDKHLPQEGNDRRRLLLVLLLIVFLGGGAYLVIGKPWKNNPTVLQNATLKAEQPGVKGEVIDIDNAENRNDTPFTEAGQSPSNSIITEAGKTAQPGQTTSINSNKRNSKSVIEQRLVERNNVNPASPVIEDNEISRKTGQEKQGQTAKSKIQEQPAESENEVVEAVEKTAVQEDKEPSTISPKELNDSRVKDTSEVLVKTDTEQPAIAANKENNSETVQPAGGETTTELASPDIANLMEEQQKMARKRFRQSIGITFSIGPDISGMPSTGAGEITTNYGIGVSYKPGKRWLLRTGVQVSDKIYSAAPEDYSPPKDYWTNYVNMLGVDANCRIVEMPILISYNLTDGEKGNLFVTTGLSSYFMKKEYYYYHYYDQWGQYQYGYTRKENGKNHFLSVVTAGAGYSYRVNDRFSMMAEPYVKLPLAGVGFGKIKLKSGGVLFTATYNPFR